MPAAIGGIAAMAWFPQLRVMSIEAGIALAHAVLGLGSAGWAWFGWLGPIALALLWAFRARIRRSVEGFFSPLHAHKEGREWRYRLRILWRVRWLELRLWWRQPKLGTLRRHWPRPLALLIAGSAAILLLRWAFGPETGGFFTHLSKLLTGGKDLDWRDAAQPLLALIGLPVAFLLWWFRDIHVNETLENQRKDVNLKQFQEVQIRAAGALDEKLPARARETTQIAAIHQLRPFLKGEFGESFRRPAWELLRARLAASAEVTRTRAIAQWIDRWHAERHRWGKRDDEQRRGREPPFAVSAFRAELAAALAERLTPSSVSEAERAVLREEWRTIFRSALPLAETCFDRIDLPAGVLLSSCNLSRCTFVGAGLVRARLDGADLRWARLDGANLGGARLDGANLRWARLGGADLGRARLDGADLRWARLDGADLREARLDGADLREARLDGADLWDAWLPETVLEKAWLDGADLRRALLIRASLRGASLKGANLVKARLEGAKLYGANLRGAWLDGADLRRARFDGANLEEARFDGADLRGARLDYRARLSARWEELPESERETHRQVFRDRGAVFREEVGQE